MSPPHLELHVSGKDFEIMESEELQVIFKMALIFYTFNSKKNRRAHHGSIEGTLDEVYGTLGRGINVLDGLEPIMYPVCVSLLYI